jgi:hypothetical protein
MNPKITREVLDYELERLTELLSNTSPDVINTHPHAQAIKQARGLLRRMAGLQPM